MLLRVGYIHSVLTDKCGPGTALWVPQREATRAGQRATGKARTCLHSLLIYGRNESQNKRQSTKTADCIHGFKSAALLAWMSQLSLVIAELEQSNFSHF